MSKRAIIFLSILLLGLQLCLCMCASAATIVVDSMGGGDTTTIATALDVAEDGDTIFVRSGIYDENIYVNNDLSALKGEDKSTTIIHGRIDVDEVDDFTISGFTFVEDCNMEIRGNNLIIDDNVFMDSNKRHTLQDVIYIGGDEIKLSNNSFCYGVSVGGSDCVITDNNCTLSEYVRVYGGERNIIERNVFRDVCVAAVDSKLANNTIGVDGVQVRGKDCLITHNTITGFNNKYLEYSRCSGIELLGTDAATITENTISNFEIGIVTNTGIPNTGHIHIDHNTIVNCDTGIINNCADISITCNTFVSNGCGIETFMPSDRDCRIYKNNFLNNQRQNAISHSSGTLWDNGEEGNYWSDYNGPDADGDGIGDKPYINLGEGCKDHYPLMESNDACGSGIPIPSPTAIPTAAPTSTKTPTTTTFEPTIPLSESIPGFEVILGLLCLLAVSCLFNRRK